MTPPPGGVIYSVKKCFLVYTDVLYRYTIQAAYSED